MHETNTMLSTDLILQGSDVIISVFIIVAMSFVPASFTLFHVYERATKSKHIQYINGLYPLMMIFKILNMLSSFMKLLIQLTNLYFI
jgi:ATP-binding cassette subfamily A (ABC1) protein 2